MSAGTLDAPTLAPISEDEVEAFTRTLEDTPPPVCEFRGTEGPCTEAAAWRLTLRPCRHVWLLCGEHRATVDFTLSRAGCSCGRCGTFVRSATWVAL